MDHTSIITFGFEPVNHIFKMGDKYHEVEGFVTKRMGFSKKEGRRIPISFLSDVKTKRSRFQRTYKHLYFMPLVFALVILTSGGDLKMIGIKKSQAEL
ncbi:hypothetical protein AOC36_07530 [Erysipelothrix larvae]|uniref:Uncharacterized protein n=1 Tax=Erysipelothrix larvae TaxID=1514105 RepID=A0A120JTT4_9FIRM|nr:hypothetical protein AOC36_07530 [Erysipelothrix larvae]